MNDVSNAPDGELSAGADLGREIAKIVNQRLGPARRTAKAASEAAQEAMSHTANLGERVRDLTIKVDDVASNFDKLVNSVEAMADRPTFDPETFQEEVLRGLRENLETDEE